WMDVKIGDWVVTPRTGKPVEVNALWYNALCILADFARLMDSDPTLYDTTARRVRESFSKFWHKGYCFDVIGGPGGNDAALRPNQLIAVSLLHSLLTPEQQRAIVDVCERRLLTPRGLRSLDRDDPAYIARYGGDRAHRDPAYHQGTVWSWLIGPFVEAHLRVYGDKARARAYLLPVLGNLDEAVVGSISEIFDAEPPHYPRGAFAQAWAVAGDSAGVAARSRVIGQLRCRSGFFICSALEDPPGDFLPEQPTRDQGEAEQPHPRRDTEGQEQAGTQARIADPAREQALITGETQRSEIRQGVVDQHGEGAERPGRADIADKHQRRDETAHHDNGSVRCRAAGIQLTDDGRHIAAAAHRQQNTRQPQDQIQQHAEHGCDRADGHNLRCDAQVKVLRGNFQRRGVSFSHIGEVARAEDANGNYSDRDIQHHRRDEGCDDGAWDGAAWLADLFTQCGDAPVAGIGDKHQGAGVQDRLGNILKFAVALAINEERREVRAVKTGGQPRDDKKSQCAEGDGDDQGVSGIRTPDATEDDQRESEDGSQGQWDNQAGIAVQGFEQVACKTKRGCRCGGALCQ
ncbi:hypothetical protein HC928_21310, partial [bacterium]|nr:hypothetical protein [bacterium]